MQDLWKKNNQFCSRGNLNVPYCFVPDYWSSGRRVVWSTGQPEDQPAGRLAGHPAIKGFTLVEILLVIVMLAFVSLAVYAVFNSGIKIWQKVSKEVPEEELNIFFARFAGDLRNSFKFSGFDFLGQDDALEFTFLVSSPGLNKRSVGRVGYLYDFSDKIIVRKESDYSQAYNQQQKGRQVLSNVSAFNFQYYFYDKEKKEYLWKSRLEKGESPLAVRIELDLGNENSAVKFTKTVSIPVS